VLLNISGDGSILGPIIDEMPFLTWIHSITAGVDHILCPSILDNPDLILTNAKGVYSSSLAEYVIGLYYCIYIYILYYYVILFSVFS
jgi:phosphoglycerate dehydrogenase-like enzyme